MEQRKIINDPLYGFLSIKTELIYKLIQHPYFQRLRNIKQLGLTSYVYPGAQHTRFHHAIGAMHLMGVTLDTLRSKGHEVSEEEYEAAMIAVLLHDVGHGPFSHALENTILKGTRHEVLSVMIMQKLNEEFGGRLSLSLDIFSDRYPRRFFHQLVSSQLDVDRLDYLCRDSFFTGVAEGNVGVERIIRMLDIDADRIVVEEKGVYSIEHFLNSRRLMYWQVYLHKTTVSTEQMLTQVIRRARQLTENGQQVTATPALKVFLDKSVTTADFEQNPYYLSQYVLLDDHDVWGSMKFWLSHPDGILRTLSGMILERRLFRAHLTSVPFGEEEVATLKEKVAKHFSISGEDEVSYFFTQGTIYNSAYNAGAQNILIKRKNGKIMDITEATDLPNIEAISKIVAKHYLCYPKEVR